MLELELPLTDGGGEVKSSERLEQLACQAIDFLGGGFGMSTTDALLWAAMMVAAPAVLTLIVVLLVYRQNGRVLANQADQRLQAMLRTRDFLDALAQDASMPEGQRRRAQALARDYPSGDQLRVFAEHLADNLRRVTREPS